MGNPASQLAARHLFPVAERRVENVKSVVHFCCLLICCFDYVYYYVLLFFLSNNEKAFHTRK